MSKDEEKGAIQGGVQGMGAGAAASGGNPWVAGAGGLIGALGGYVMAQRDEKERKKAEEYNMANVTHENLYAPYFKRARAANPKAAEGDPASGAWAGGVQGLEQGGKFAQMVAAYNDKEDAKRRQGQIDKANLGINTYEAGGGGTTGPGQKPGAINYQADMRFPRSNQKPVQAGDQGRPATHYAH